MRAQSVALLLVSCRAAPEVPAGLEPMGMNDRNQREFRSPRDGSIYVEIPGGAFRAGPAADTLVEVDRFLLSKFEVTNRQYQRFLAATGRSAPSTCTPPMSRAGSIPTRRSRA
jgi:formylglycine-generating enzyme required for sulfatase activity